MAHKDGTKSGGRKKGTPNRVSTERKAMISELIFGDWDKVEEDLEKVSPRERLDFKAKLMPFVVSKMQSTDSTHSFNFDNMTDEQIDKIFHKILNTGGNDE